MQSYTYFIRPKIEDKNRDPIRDQSRDIKKISIKAIVTHFNIFYRLLYTIFILDCTEIYDGPGSNRKQK